MAAQPVAATNKMYTALRHQADTKILASLALVLMLQIFGTVAENVPYTLPPDFVCKDGETFDYVVVGAGAAGCAAAGVLARAGKHVLLVEAGANPPPHAAVPVAAMSLLGSSIDWQYETMPNNKSCLSSRGRACRFARGKCLGGSTSINFMMFIRGNRQDYDGLRIPSWTWKDLKPYFLRYESFQNITRLPRRSRPFHNTSGIIKVGFFDDPENPWHSRIVQGFRSLKFENNRDMNAVSQIGVGQIAGYVHNGLRMSAARAYLANDEVKSCHKPKVTKNTLCTGLIINKCNVTTGITVVRGPLKIPMSINARKEVILSAGTIGTPQILMLSGIGHAGHLQEMGIKVRADLPVGDNMSDHVLPIILLMVDGNRNLLEKTFSLLQTVGDLAEFLVKMGGPIASIGLTDITAFWNSNCYRTKKLRIGSNCKLPNLQMIFSYIDRGLITIARPLVQKVINLNNDVMDQLAAANSKRAFIVFSPVLLSPVSGGTVRLASADPFDHPAIFPNYMADARDVEVLVRAINLIEDLIETPPFKAHNATILRLDFPDCPSSKDGKDYWECYSRHMTNSVYHAVGTCAMRSVVNPQLQLRCVDHTRIADISVLPEIPRGNTEAIAIAIGEKAAAMALKHNRKKDDKCDKLHECHQNDPQTYAIGFKDLVRKLYIYFLVCLKKYVK